MRRERNACGDRHAPPSRPTLDRRRLLQATGALAIGTTVAGCVGRSEPSASIGERPAYSRWIGSEHLESATAEGDGLLFVRTGFRELRELEGSEDAFVDLGDGTTDEELYELALAPMWGTVAFLLVSSLGLIAYGRAAVEVLGAIETGLGTGSPATEPETEPPHVVDTGVLAGRLVAFEGDFDVDALGAAAESFEPTEEYGGYQLFEGTTAYGSTVDAGDLAFAASENAVLFPFPGSDVREAGEWSSFDPTAILQSHVDVAAGDAEEAADGNEDFDWALRAGGGGAFVLGGHRLDGTGLDRSAGTADGPDLVRLDPLLRDARSFALSASFDVDGRAVLAEGGFAYADEASRPEEAAFEALADGATTSSVTVDATRAHVEAEWTGDGAGTPSS